MPATLALLLGLGLAASPPAVRAEEDAEVRQCREWIQAHSPAPPAKTALTRIVSPRTLCFDGEIYAPTVKDANAWADGARTDPRSRPRLVVRSTGGDADPAMALAEKLQRVDAEVTVVDYCMSSCANYFFAAIPRRRVVPGALLLFHGGYTARDHAETAEMFDKALHDPALAARLADPARWRAAALDKVDGGLALQTALFRRSGVDPLLVTGMHSVDQEALPASACGPRPGARRAFLFFGVRQLRRLGLAIAAGTPASDPAGVDRRLAQFGFSFTACAAPATYFKPQLAKGK